MNPAQIQAELKKAMELRTTAVWTRMNEPKMIEEGYTAITGAVVDFPGDGKPKYSYLVVAKVGEPDTARGTYTDVANKTVINLPPENAWILFEEALKYLTKV